ncbi:MAG: hypothetical protein J6Z82_02950 [Schwartzia sp.]|nr:hypothetical protein [Schwartzia sp. (in: firmicutes)]
MDNAKEQERDALQEKESQAVYGDIRQSIITARQSVSRVVNSSMVMLYWEVGQKIDLACSGKRAEYGNGLLSMLSKRLTAEFGKGYTVRNLQVMRQFYEAFPNTHTLCAQLSWSHYRLLVRVADPKARAFYTAECSSAGWSVRELERQITTFTYQRTLSKKESAEKLPCPAENETKDVPYKDFIRDPYVLEFLNLKASPEFYEKTHIYASKYLPYLPTEEELRQELCLDRLPPSTGA